MILLQALAVSILVSLIFGGKLSRLASLTLHWGWLGLLSVALQLVVIYANLPDTLGAISVRLVSMLLAYGLLIVMVLANAKLPGFWWIGLGMAVNLVAMLANDGWMPISPETLARAGLGHLATMTEAGTYVAGSKDVVLAHAEANLWFLGDVFVCRFMHAAFSIGDVLLVVGASWFFWRQTRPLEDAETALIDS